MQAYNILLIANVNNFSRQIHIFCGQISTDHMYIYLCMYAEYKCIKAPSRTSFLLRSSSHIADGIDVVECDQACVWMRNFYIDIIVGKISTYKTVHVPLWHVCIQTYYVNQLFLTCPRSSSLALKDKKILLKHSGQCERRNFYVMYENVAVQKYKIPEVLLDGDIWGDCTKGSTYECLNLYFLRLK